MVSVLYHSAASAAFSSSVLPRAMREKPLRACASRTSRTCSATMSMHAASNGVLPISPAWLATYRSMAFDWPMAPSSVSSSGARPRLRASAPDSLSALNSGASKPGPMEHHERVAVHALLLAPGVHHTERDFGCTARPGWCVRTECPSPLARAACRRPERVARARRNEVPEHPSEQRLAPLQQVVCGRLGQQRDDRAQPQASEEALVDQGRVRAAVHALLDLREAERRHERRQGHHLHERLARRPRNSFAPCWPGRGVCKEQSQCKVSNRAQGG